MGKAFDASCWWCKRCVQRCLEFRDCGFDPPSLNVGQGFRGLGLSSIIFLSISMALFDYYAMSIAKLNGVEFFNDLERFLVLLFSSSESIVDKAQETSFEGSPTP